MLLLHIIHVKTAVSEQRVRPIVVELLDFVVIHYKTAKINFITSWAVVQYIVLRPISLYPRPMR